MTFKEFWPIYMRAHRLAGTRGLHYFATAVGIMSTIEAIVARQPLIFVLGIAVSYLIAIATHWLVEHNQPLIRVNALWGAIADLRMCWLALTGQVANEFARHGIAQPRLPNIANRVDSNGRDIRQWLMRHLNGRNVRYGLLAASAAGLAVGLVDLTDLKEPAESIAHPVIQLGAPIAAFLSALLAAFSAIAAARQFAQAPLNTLRSDATPGGSVPGGAILGANGLIDPSSAGEESLRRACMAFLAFGLVAFGLAELHEHGWSDPIDLVGALAALMMLLCVGAILVWPRGNAVDAGCAGSVSLDGSCKPETISGPWTRGLRVDGRVHLVDTMENLLSGGRREAILQATLDAADLLPGQRLVDVGCGTGELAMMAARIGSGRSRADAGEAIGIDATPGMIEIARWRAYQNGSTARFELGVAEALPLADGMADAVTSSFFFHHLPTEVKREAMREMWRVLAPGGRLVITDYGWARGIVGLIASFPMRFNFHEYVRGQLNGELERIVSEECLVVPEATRVFLGYIKVLRIVKPADNSPPPSSKAS